jgi:hypothetical protein
MKKEKGIKELLMVILMLMHMKAEELEKMGLLIN